MPRRTATLAGRRPRRGRVPADGLPGAEPS